MVDWSLKVTMQAGLVYAVWDVLPASLMAGLICAILYVDFSQG